MSNIKGRLLEEKLHLSELFAPEELEVRLRSALNAAVPRRKAIRNVKSGWRMAAAILAVMLVAGNQYHALAYYGKTLLGFDRVVNGNLGELIKQGKGQTLDEQVQLADGTILTVDGIMADENQFILYYTLSNPNDGSFLPTRLKGFQTDSQIQTNSWGPSEERTETKGFMTFEPVSPLAKKITLSYWEELPESDQRREGQITFPYHPDEAMPTKIKQFVNETLTVESQTITIGTVTATPTMTLIEGTLQNQQLDQDFLDEVVLNGIDLIANGDSIPLSRGDVHRTQDGMAFSLRYDSLPDNLHSVQLILKKTGDIVQITVK